MHNIPLSAHLILHENLFVAYLYHVLSRNYIQGNKHQQTERNKEVKEYRAKAREKKDEWIRTDYLYYVWRVACLTLFGDKIKIISNENTHSLLCLCLGLCLIPTVLNIVKTSAVMSVTIKTFQSQPKTYIGIFLYNFWF